MCIPRRRKRGPMKTSPAEFDELERELSEAYRREAATAEVLKIISRYRSHGERVSIRHFGDRKVGSWTDLPQLESWRGLLLPFTNPRARSAPARVAGNRGTPAGPPTWGNGRAHASLRNGAA